MPTNRDSSAQAPFPATRGPGAQLATLIAMAAAALAIFSVLQWGVLGGVSVVIVSAICLAPSSDQRGRSTAASPPARGPAERSALSAPQQLLLGAALPGVYVACQSQLVLDGQGTLPWFCVTLLLLIALQGALFAAWLTARPLLLPWAGLVSGALNLGAVTGAVIVVLTLKESAALALVLGIGLIGFVPLASAALFAVEARRAAELALPKPIPRKEKKSGKAGEAGKAGKAGASGKAELSAGYRRELSRLRRQQWTGAVAMLLCGGLLAAAAKRLELFDYPWLSLWPLAR